MLDIAVVLESYLIPAEEGFIANMKEKHAKKKEILAPYKEVCTSIEEKLTYTNVDNIAHEIYTRTKMSEIDISIINRHNRTIESEIHRGVYSNATAPGIFYKIIKYKDISFVFSGILGFYNGVTIPTPIDTHNFTLKRKKNKD